MGWSYPEAEEAFQRALSSPDPNLQGNAYYNLGNAQYKHGESLEETDPDKAMELMQKSIESYDASMLRTPSDDARHNQQVVKHRLNQLKAEQKAKKDAKEAKDSQSQSQSGGQNQSGSAPQTQKDQSGQGDPRPFQSAHGPATTIDHEKTLSHDAEEPANLRTNPGGRAPTSTSYEAGSSARACNNHAGPRGSHRRLKNCAP